MLEPHISSLPRDPRDPLACLFPSAGRTPPKIWADLERCTDHHCENTVSFTPQYAHHICRLHYCRASRLCTPVVSEHSPSNQTLFYHALRHSQPISAILDTMACLARACIYSISVSLAISELHLGLQVSLAEKIQYHPSSQIDTSVLLPPTPLTLATGTVHNCR